MMRAGWSERAFFCGRRAAAIHLATHGGAPSGGAGCSARPPRRAACLSLHALRSQSGGLSPPSLLTILLFLALLSAAAAGARLGAAAVLDGAGRHAQPAVGGINAEAGHGLPWASQRARRGRPQAAGGAEEARPSEWTSRRAHARGPGGGLHASPGYGQEGQDASGGCFCGRRGGCGVRGACDGTRAREDRPSHVWAKKTGLAFLFLSLFSKKAHKPCLSATPGPAPKTVRAGRAGLYARTAAPSACWLGVEIEGALPGRPFPWTRQRVNNASAPRRFLGAPVRQSDLHTPPTNSS